MSVEAGRLRHRISFEARTVSRPSNSEAVKYTWSKIPNGDDWADMQDFSTREFVAAASVQSKATGRAIVRYRSDVTADMRINFDGVIYSIEGPPLRDKDSGREYMTIPVSRGANRGA